MNLLSLKIDLQLIHLILNKIFAFDGILLDESCTTRKGYELNLNYKNSQA